MRKADHILDEEGSMDWTLGRMAQNIARTMPKKIGRPTKRKRAMPVSMRIRREIDRWNADCREVTSVVKNHKEIDDWGLTMKAMCDRVLSITFKELGYGKYNR